MNLVEQLWADPLARQCYISAVLLVVPVTRIFKRTGFSPFWAALLIVPVFGLVLCTVLLALRKWPQAKEV